MGKHHLRSLTNFPFNTALINISDSPGVMTNPAKPASHACTQINPMSTRTMRCQSHGESWASPPGAACPPQPRRQTLLCPPTPRVGFCLFFCRGFLVWSAGLLSTTLYMHINIYIQADTSLPHPLHQRRIWVTSAGTDYSLLHIGAFHRCSLRKISDYYS